MVLVGLREHHVQRFELGMGGMDRFSMPGHRLPVAAFDRPRELEVVLDDPAHQRVERLGGRAGALEEPARDPTERYEVVRRDRSACVVERAARVGQLERPEPEERGKLQPYRRARVGVRRERGPGAVELLRAAAMGERLERVQREPPLVRAKRSEGRRSRDVRNPGAGCELTCDACDRVVGNAEKDDSPGRGRRDGRRARQADRSPRFRRALAHRSL